MPNSYYHELLNEFNSSNCISVVCYYRGNRQILFNFHHRIRINKRISIIYSIQNTFLTFLKKNKYNMSSIMYYDKKEAADSLNICNLFNSFL